jgi:polyhydroxyalkanoate synthase
VSGQLAPVARRITTAAERIVGRPIADLTPMPASVIHDSPHCSIRWFRSTTGRTDRCLPILLVPPLGVSSDCFDLRRGCSLVEYLLSGGYHVYLVDYGAIGRRDRSLGLEHLVDDVLPRAVDVVATDRGASPQLIGWCLGGILSLLLAARSAPAVESVSMIGSPFEGSLMMRGWLGWVVDVGHGQPVIRATTLAGGVPAPLIRAAYRIAAVDRYLTRPLTVLSHLGNREFLAQIEAVDAYAARMRGYPGRALGQVHHALFSSQGLTSGAVQFNGLRLRLADVRVPVLAIAAARDRFAPPASVNRVAQLLPNAAEVTLRVAPGGHLGALTGRRARGTTWRFLDEFLTRHEQGVELDALD